MTGPPLKPHYKRVVSEDFCGDNHERGVPSFRCFLVFWLRNSFLEKWMVAIAFSICWLWWLVVDFGTRLEERGWQQKKLNKGFLPPPFLRGEGLK